ncbi:hypothetical protein ACP70R_030463 [Stipagrostis hirtigluma subsp. patula]
MSTHEFAIEIETIDPVSFGTSPSDDMNAACEPGSSRQLVRLLFSLGFLTLVTDLATALYRPPKAMIFESHKLAYYLTLAGIFAAGVAELWPSASPAPDSKPVAMVTRYWQSSSTPPSSPSPPSLLLAASPFS